MKYLSREGWGGGIAVLAAVILIAGPALAQDNTVSVPWGDWIVQVVDAMVEPVLLVLSTVVTYITAVYLPPWLNAIAGKRLQERVNEVLEKAVLSAAAQTKGAVAGKEVSLSVSNEVLRGAIEYAVELAPGLVKKATGGNMEKLVKMILARMAALGLAPKDMDISDAKKVAGL